MYKVRNILSSIDKISQYSGKATSLLILPTIIIIVYTVVMRYVLHQAPDWGFEVSLFLYGSHIMLGGAYTLKEKSHVTVDIFSKFLSERGKSVLDVISSIAILTVCMIIVIQGSHAAWESTKILERSIHQSSFNPQIWWFRWVIPISAGLIVLQALKDMIIAFGKCFKRRN